MSSESTDPQIILATPALFLPGMNQQEWDFEVGRMLDRAQATHDFLQGKLSPDEYEQALDQFGVDPRQAAADWDDGKNYLYG